MSTPQNPQPQPAKQPKDRMPWAFVIGLVLLVLGALLASNDGGGIAALMIVLGIVLIPTGLIQRSIEKRRAGQ